MTKAADTYGTSFVDLPHEMKAPPISRGERGKNHNS